MGVELMISSPVGAKEKLMRIFFRRLRGLHHEKRIARGLRSPFQGFACPTCILLPLSRLSCRCRRPAEVVDCGDDVFANTPNLMRRHGQKGSFRIVMTSRSRMEAAEPHFPYIH
jgi:hypothetical protein